jgi:hypothetical protein
MYWDISGKIFYFLEKDSAGVCIPTIHINSDYPLFHPKILYTVTKISPIYYPATHDYEGER